MKQTNLFNYRLGMSRSGIAKPLGFIAACLAVLFVFSLQQASAQTMSEMGELQADHTITLIKGEMQFLEQELKYPVGNVNTDQNGQLLRYYRHVISLFEDDVDMKVALMEVGPANTPIGSSSASIEDIQASTVVGQVEAKQLSLLVDQLNLRDSDDSDLIAIFNLLRTLKNQ